MSAPKNILLRAQDITVRFGGLTAVDAVSVDIQAGELVAESLRLAQNALGEITGDFSADDLLGKIFGSFCIGK